MQPRSPGSPTATCGMHACDNCAEQHRHGPFQDKALESSRGRSESRPSLAQRRTRCSRSRMGAVDKSVHKLLRALLRRSGSHRMITIGSLSSSPSSSARKPARTLPIRTRVTTTTTTAAPPRIPTAANDAWRLYGPVGDFATPRASRAGATSLCPSRRHMQKTGRVYS